MKRRAGLLLVGVVLVAGFSLLFVFPLREAFRTGLLQPLIETWHVISWYVLRLPQAVLWIGALIVGVVFLVRSLVKGLGEGATMEAAERPAPQFPTEFEHLSWLIAHARYRPFSRRRLAGELVAPCVRLIAGREGLSLPEARTRFEGFAWCDEPAVADFFAYRQYYRGLGRRADFEEKLEKTVSFLERYQEGNRWN